MSQGKAQTIAGYRLEQRLAVGGMAEIYRAVRGGPGAFAKTVALKMVLPELARDAQFIEMFLEEARLAARLSSPHLVQVFDFGEQEGTYFMAMELVEGLDLATLLAARGRLPLPLAVHLGRQLCAALVDLHGAIDDEGRPLGIIHRDVTPGNVLLSLAGDVKLGDLGIARAATPGLRTERGAIKGKLAYLSPEQARGDDLDARTDIYGVGLLLFEALTGQRYLEAKGEAALLRLAEKPQPRRPSQLREDLPPSLDEVVARALAPVPADRFADAGRLDAALAASGEQVDPAALRRQLAAAVQQARQGPATPAKPAPGPAWAPAEGAAPAGVRATEVLDPAARAGSSWMLLIGLGIGALLLGAIVTVSSSSSSPTTDGGLDAALRATAGGLDARSTTLPRDATGAAALVVAPDTGPGDAARPAAPIRRAPRPTPAARKPPSTAPDAGAPAPLPDAAAPQFRRRLTELRAALARKGVLRADLPQVFATLDELQRGTASETEVAALARTIDAISIDRAFVDAKLGRLNRRIASAQVGTEVQRRLGQRASRALSHAVTGRYTEANRELNAIARIIER